MSSGSVLLQEPICPPADPKIYTSPTYQKRYDLGLCIYCGEVPPRHGKSSCAACGAKFTEHNRRYRDKNRDWYNSHMSEYRKVKGFADRMRVLYHYGGSPPSCACCGLTSTSGNTAIAFFAIDHINGYDADSGQPRASDTLVRWIIRNSFPPGFQVLCHCCNMGRAILGRCPHEIEREKSPPDLYDGGGGV